MIVNVIFDAGKGSVSEASREQALGVPFGSLPIPVRAGYRFEGWYLRGTRVTESTVLEAEDDIRLQALWTKVKEKRKSSSFKRQKTAVIVLAAVAVLLLVAWAIVSQIIAIYYVTDTYVDEHGKEQSERYTIKREDGVYKMFDSDGTRMPNREGNDEVFITKGGNQYHVDPLTGECVLKAYVDNATLTDHEAAVGTTLLLYPEITASTVYSIEVTNAFGSYTFVHTPEKTYIEGFENARFSYDQQLYARLVFSCGWTSVTRKLTTAAAVAMNEAGEIDYAAYGLDEPQASFRVRGIKEKVEVSDGDDYFVPDPNQDYTVYVGDLTPSGNSYYVRIEGTRSQAVYILNSTYISQTILEPIESMIKPQAVHTVSVNTHSMANDFALFKLDNWTLSNPEGIGELVVAFTYDDLEHRRFTLNQTAPYLNSGAELMGGYAINDTSASTVLSQLYALECLSCVRLGVNNETLTEFGLDQNVYYLTYELPDYPDDPSVLLIAREKNENGNYYVASVTYDMILEIEPEFLPFIEWRDADWYKKYFLQMELSYLKGLKFQFGDEVYDFTMDNSDTYSYYRTTSDGITYLEKADLNYGYLVSENGKTYYKTGDASYRITSVIDFDTVQPVTFREAMTNTSLRNVIFRAENFYYAKDGEAYRIETLPQELNAQSELTDQVLYKSIKGDEENGFYLEFTLRGKEYKLALLRTLSEELYYRDKNGYVATLMLDSDGMVAIMDGTAINYTISINSSSITTGNDTVEYLTANENLRRLYRKLILLSLEGDVNEKDVQERYGMTVEEFIASRPAMASIQIKGSDYASLLNGYTYFDGDEELRWHTEDLQKNILVSFYRYTPEKAIVTLQLLDENGKPTGEAEGRFYVQAEYLEKLEGYVKSFVSREEVPE